MKKPTVSFVVPCYKLAHLLPECINSILGQTYLDFEILIMDDASPDNTAQVARSFQDPRVRYIRNEPNLGSLRNYNKGINLSQGRYIWLISADDYLRRSYLLKKYVNLMDENPSIGYTICCGVGVRDGIETQVLDYSVYCNQDKMVKGHVFLESLLKSNFVLAPSGMVRRECYDQLGLFPLQKELMWSGDWYLWSLFALHWDVGYFAEPMICYREHGLSMTNSLKQESMDLMVAGDVAVPWMIKRKAEESNYAEMATRCMQAIVDVYVKNIAPVQPGDNLGRGDCMSIEQFEASLFSHTDNLKEQKWVAARVYAAIADRYYWRGNRAAARHYYRCAKREDRTIKDLRAKIMLCALGKLGVWVRKMVLTSRQPAVFAGSKSSL